MTGLLLLLHLAVAAVLVLVVLLQRSEGGALGMGGGGGGGFLTGRGTANLLTRTTAILAGLFFLTSLSLTLLERPRHAGPSLFEKQPSLPVPPVKPSDTSPQPPAKEGRGILDKLEPPPGTPQQPPATP